MNHLESALECPRGQYLAVKENHAWTLALTSDEGDSGTAVFSPAWLSFTSRDRLLRWLGTGLGYLVGLA